ncbi:hypothetical protein C5E22_14845 [Pectobacterium parmentieri]|uniref:Uncharacterized protein n=1 Tax=Pectobacterium parmentieri TaxID=1905730 RepID=A0A8B3F713_PECPM|nr:hypothetical protein C5E24_07955 [Pectobacterium parmentieri]AYH19668.1 hypothetical protein C5E22_14845 [Pectobacterium parmentieri]AYH35935.1 hypothetical protein C5E17_07825 [Pectobacterium parmentieri]AZS56004.1 hypothetical protein C5E18_07660 [Pectobacterium parmentieri]RKO75629.1 hypothetical protein C5E00_01920 [Pectobacterium parmentieri]
MAIDQIAQLGLSSLQVIYYLAKLFRVVIIFSYLPVIVLNFVAMPVYCNFSKRELKCCARYFIRSC